jgi:hypothetical protein
VLLNFGDRTVKVAVDRLLPGANELRIRLSTDPARAYASVVTTIVLGPDEGVLLEP